MLQKVFAVCRVNYLIFILQFKYRHFANCWKHKDTVRFKQVPLFVTVLSVSTCHEQAHEFLWSVRVVILEFLGGTEVNHV